MELIFNYMDDFGKYLRHLPRRAPLCAQVSNIGYMKAKPNLIDQVFSTANFSFILSGTGHYRKNGKTWTVQAPCVLTQWPGEGETYGPDTTWEELYLIYDAEQLPRFVEAGAFVPERPVWHVKDDGGLRRQAAALLQLLGAEEAALDAAKVDWRCAGMILESLSSEEVEPSCREERVVRGVRAELERDYLAARDFDALARANGMSPATFRRAWAKHGGGAPGAYQLSLKIRKACSLLVETRLTAGEIADQLGYDDRLYFYRLFKKKTGMTALEYRSVHRDDALFPQ